MPGRDSRGNVFKLRTAPVSTINWHERLNKLLVESLKITILEGDSPRDPTLDARKVVGAMRNHLDVMWPSDTQQTGQLLFHLDELLWALSGENREQYRMQQAAAAVKWLRRAGRNKTSAINKVSTEAGIPVEKLEHYWKNLPRSAAFESYEKMIEHRPKWVLDLLRENDVSPEEVAQLSADVLLESLKKGKRRPYG